MSRIGQQPIKIPEEVNVEEIDLDRVRLKGPRGELLVAIPSRIKVKQEDRKVKVLRQGESRRVKALHGLVRSLINNAVIGVTRGFQKTLEIEGVGYRAKVEGEKLILTVGFSHPVIFPKLEGIEFQVSGNKIIVSGIEKQLVGQTAAKIRKIKPPDPYKGKGIRYAGEVIKLKPGKAAKGAGVGGK